MIKEVGLSMPVVVRLTGTKSKEGVALVDKFCKETGQSLIIASDLDDAAGKAVKALV